MKVKSLELIRLRSYNRLKIELSPSINLFVGANNSGKSTIIQALRNLQYHSFSRTDIRGIEWGAQTLIELIDISPSDVTLFYNSQFRDQWESSNKFNVVWGLTRSPQAMEQNLYYDGNIKTTRLIDDEIKKVTDNGNEPMPWKQFPRFPDNEERNNFIYPFLAKRKNNNYYSNSSLEETFRVAEDLSNLAGKIQKISNPTHKHNQRFSELCQDILGFKIGLIPTTNQNNGIEPGIYTSTKTFIPMRSMGEGVANIIGFLITLLTEDNKLYLIEELENDIHPKALKKLLPLILEKSINNQFVISTHSHIVLNHLGVNPESKIFYTSWKPYDHKNEPIPTTSLELIDNNPRSRMDLLEKLGYDFIDFELFNAYLILEESSAEKVIRDFLIPNFVPKLYNKIKTIASNGVDDLKHRVSDFNRLFVFIHTSPVYFKKAWIIADGDQNGKDVIKEIKTKYKKWPKDHFINFKNNFFENYYPTRFKSEVDKVLSMPHGQKKQNAKIELLNKVMLWALNNREQAIKEFSESCKEIIAILKSISSEISRTSK